MAKINQITINQHYVPQFLLKHFGQQVKKTTRLNIFDIVRQHIRYNQSTEEIFSQNYFYDKDNSVENLLGQVETSAGIVINKIASGQLFISTEDRWTLIKFISSLLSRTPTAREKAISFMNSFYKLVSSKLLDLNGFDPNEASKISIQNRDPSNLISDLALQGVVNAGILIDLDFHIIKNDSKLEFFISDHPVFVYNWLYRDSDDPGVSGLTMAGVQIFMPISPRLLICLYDSEIYKYGRKSLSVTRVSNVADIEILNSFQIINAESIIGFHDKTDESNLKELYKKHKEFKAYRHESKIIKEEICEDGTPKSTRIITIVRQNKLSKMPSFVSIKKKAKNHASRCYIRNPALIDLHYKNTEQMRKEIR